MDDSSSRESGSWDAGSLEQWLDRMAESRGVSEEEVLQQLASALWTLDELETMVAETDLHESLPPGESPRDATGSRSDLGDDVAGLGDDVADLRGRVEALADAVGDVEDEVAALERDTTADFDNVEEVLRYLVERTDEVADDVASVESRLDAAAAAVGARDRERATLESLLGTANDHGVTRADCEQCGSTVHFANLVAPTCPTCAASFHALAPKSWWLGTNRLLTAPDGEPAGPGVDREPFGENRREPPEGATGSTDDAGTTVEPPGDGNEFIWESDG